MPSFLFALLFNAVATSIGDQVVSDSLELDDALLLQLRANHTQMSKAVLSAEPKGMGLNVICDDLVASFLGCLEQWMASSSFSSICANVDSNTLLCEDGVSRFFFQAFAEKMNSRQLEKIEYTQTIGEKSREFHKVAKENRKSSPESYKYCRSNSDCRSRKCYNPVNSCMTWQEKNTLEKLREEGLEGRKLQHGIICQKYGALEAQGMASASCAAWSEELYEDYQKGTFSNFEYDSFLLPIYQSIQTRQCQSKLGSVLVPMVTAYVEQQRRCNECWNEKTVGEWWQRDKKWGQGVKRCLTEAGFDVATYGYNWKTAMPIVNEPSMELLESDGSGDNITATLTALLESDERNGSEDTTDSLLDLTVSRKSCQATR